MSFDQRRRRVDDLRAIPLPQVLHAAGAESDPHDSAKWHTAQGVLSINGPKFFNWNQGRGGGGAIDLAMHLHACAFPAAVQWLQATCESAGAGSPAGRPIQADTPRGVATTAAPPSLPPSHPVLVLPTPAPWLIDRIQRYLREQRRLPESLLKPLRGAGLLYADHHANAVFLLLGKEGRPVGAELRGTWATPWRGLTPGSRKDLGYFACGPVHAAELVLCESAIDAISCAAIYPDRRCLSTAGARPNPAWLAQLLPQHDRIYCGFDADPTGDQMARTMGALYPAIYRLRPPLHDWNDVLIASA